MENLRRLLFTRELSGIWIKLCGFVFGGAAAFLLIFSRRPDAILNPQFWAEDGKVWYEMAYNGGAIRSLFVPESSYYQTISRLIAGFSQVFSLADAPLIFNLFAISCKIAVCYFLASTRFAKLIPAVSMRFLLAFIYLALPNSYEVNANLSNAQWHLAVLSFLILVSQPSEKIWWRAFDVLVLLISALSGPFCIFLFPVGLICYWKTRRRWTLYLLLVLSGGCLIQGFSILTHSRVTKVPLGANLTLFSDIIGGQIFFSSIFGGRIYGRLVNREQWSVLFSAVALIIGFGLLIYGFFKAPLELKLLMIFSFLICTGALLSPAASENIPQWQVLSYPYVGTRYWFIPIFCFLTTLLYLVVTAKNTVLKWTTAGLLALSSFGIAADWKYPPFKDFEFSKYAAEFENAAPGTEFQIPINPDWKMTLRKK